MILNRIGNAIKRQDWFVVLIELLIVVVGIYIGLQVDDWNTERERDKTERIYLERLQADIAEMKSANTAATPAMERRLKAVSRALTSLQTCTLTPEAKADLDFILISHQGLFRLVIVRATFDEMVGSGVLARLKDIPLKNALSGLYARAEAGEKIIDYFISDLGRASSIIWDHVSFSVSQGDELDTNLPLDEDFEELYTNVSYDFEVLCNSNVFKNALVEVMDSNLDRQATNASLIRDLEAVETLLAASLDKSH